MQQIGGYEVLEEIARGGMGVVYRARDPARREVALKLLLSSETGERFAQEAKSLAKLQHPGIVRVHAFETDSQGHQFLVMELVEGESLKSRLARDGVFDIEVALRIARQLCEAVAYAHERGVIHRDLKPDNVLITEDGVAKITDFGLGRVVDQSMNLTETGQMMGTPAYMPPEQAEGDRLAMGPRSDIYSLGATLYALLTGRAPFKGSSTLNVVYAVLKTVPEPPSKYRPQVPHWLDAALMRCLEKDPTERFGNAEELAAALRLRTGTTPVQAPRRSWAPLLLAAVAVSSLVVFGLVTSESLRDPAPIPSRTPIGSPTPTVPTLSGVAREAIERGSRFAEAGEWEDAVMEYGRAIALHPEYRDAYMKRADARRLMGDLEGAIRDYDQAIVLDPRDPAGYALRGANKGDRGDWQGLLEDSSRAVELGSSKAAVYSQLGQAKQRLGDPADAIEWYTQALVRNPDHAGTWASRGSARVLLGDQHGAIADCTRAIEIDPNCQKAYLNRGSARANSNDPHGAIEDYTRSLRLRPDSALTLMCRGIANASLELDAEASVDLEAALRLSPEAEWAPRAKLTLEFVKHRIREREGSRE